MQPFKLTIVLCAALLIVSCATAPHGEAPKTPIVLVSFGVFPTDDLSGFERLERDVREAYPGHALHWAFTEKTMAEQVGRDRIIFFTEEAEGREPDDVVRRLAVEGHRKVLLQPLTMLPSEETQALRALLYPDMDIAVGAPLIGDRRDIEAVVDALGAEIESREMTIIAAPGTTVYPEGERLLVAFADAAEAAYDDTFVMSVDGLPGERRLEEAKALAREEGAVHVIPFTFLPRESSLTNRLFERQEDWQTLIAKPRTTFSGALVNNESMRDILIERIAAGLDTTMALR